MTRILVRSDLFSDLDDVFRRVDAWFEGRGLDGRHGLVQLGRSPAPQLHVREDDDGWTLVADVPGLSREELEVSLDGDVLTIVGRGPEAVDDGWETVSRERPRTVSFERKVRFGRPVHADGVEARLADGVLTVRVPKRVPVAVTIPVHEA